MTIQANTIHSALKAQGITVAIISEDDRTNFPFTNRTFIYVNKKDRAKAATATPGKSPCPNAIISKYGSITAKSMPVYPSTAAKPMNFGRIRSRATTSAGSYQPRTAAKRPKLIRNTA